MKDPRLPAAFAVLRRLLTEQLPEHAARPARLLGCGEDHAVYAVGDDLLVRVLHERDAATCRALVDRELRLLRLVAHHAPVAVPRPVHADGAAGAIAYRPLPGVPLLWISGPVRLRRAESLGRQLGHILAALHAAPLAVFAPIVGVDRRAPASWSDEAADSLARVAWVLPTRERRTAVRFVEAPPAAAPFADVPVVFTHNDLGIEHVLVDRDHTQVTGIIDWSDAVVTDPAVDFARILRDLGPVAADAALAAYGRARAARAVRTARGGSAAHARRDMPRSPAAARVAQIAAAAGAEAGGPVPVTAAFRERMGFYARCLLLEDLAYGVETESPAYVMKCLDAAGWLFGG